MLKGTLRYVFLRSGISILSLLTLVGIVRLLGPTESGKVLLVVGLVQGLSLLVAGGTDAALARYTVNAGRELSLRLYRRAFLFLLGGCAITSGVLVGANLLKAVPAEISTTLVLVIGLVACYGFTSVNTFNLRGWGKLNTTSFIDGANEALPRLVALCLFFVVSPTFLAYMWVQFVIAIIVAVASYIALRRTNAGVATAEAQTNSVILLKGYWLYASMSWIGTLVILLYNNAGPWILRYLLSSEAVGFFAVASRVPTTIISLILVPLNVPLLYFFSTQNKEERSVALVNACTVLMAVMSAFSLGVAGTAEWVALHVFGKDFTAAGPALAIYAHVPFIMAYQSFLNPLLTSQNRIHLVNIMATFQIGVLVLLDFVLVPMLGVSGACLAIVLSHTILAVVYIGSTRSSVPGLFTRVLLLYVLYIPFTLLTMAHLWFVAIPTYLLVLFWLGLLDRGIIFYILALRHKIRPTTVTSKSLK